ncbi:pyrroloquinoline quinone biosynthesis peptide chaperone PqqD [Streptomyces sp. RK9]|uniref:pyrroloquinoline quinone biosynthesis peptide chaperone PqqD n=1 Tax=Streptomyces sp. RK9 TaxID=3239284 RepID=UPI00386AD35E
MREALVDGGAPVADDLGGAGGPAAGSPGAVRPDPDRPGAVGPAAVGPGVAPEPVPPDWRPVLARSVVLRRDRVRGADLLLLPERVVVLRGAAASIVALCDGERDVAGIVAELERRHPGAPVGAEVPVFLGRLRAQRWLR